MIDGLALIYPYVKAFHVMAVISWMAGLFYRPGCSSITPNARRLSRTGRKLRDHGTEAAAADHEPGDDRHVGQRIGLVVTRASSAGDDDLAVGQGGLRDRDDRVSHVVRARTTASVGRNGPCRAVLSDDERGPDSADGRDRDRRDRQVLIEKIDS